MSTGTGGRPISRRGALAALGLPVLPVLFTGGCGGSRGTVRVAVIWSGYELTAFRTVLDGFTAERGWDVAVLPVGDDIGALLGSQVAASLAPDVVLLSRPGLVHEHRDRLVPPDPTLTDAIPVAWNHLVTTVDGPRRTVHGVWYKAAYKSMVWYRTDFFDELRLTPPTNWTDWRNVNRLLAQAGHPPLALGAADGWVLSDWFENVLQGLDPQLYRELVTNPSRWDEPVIGTALALLGELWSAPDVFPDGVSRALLTQFEDSVVDVFHRGRAAMVAEGDFTLPVIRRYGDPDVPVDWFPFPAPPGGSPPVVMGGDVAVLLEPGSEGGRELIEYLSSADAVPAWAREGGFISVREGIDPEVYPREYTPELLDQVRQGADGQIPFDLSDQLVGRLGGGDGRGLWKVLQDFLARLGDGARVESAVDDAVAALSTLARG